MKNKIVALVLALTLLTGSCAYAVPLDLWKYNSRFDSIYAINRVVGEPDILQKIIDYVGIANIDDINGDDNVKPAVILGAFAEIAGFKYPEGVENSRMLADLKAAKYMRENAKASLLSMKDMIYAAARITGYVEVDDIDAIVYAKAKTSGLMRNLAYDGNRELTKSEAAQLIYNTISVQVKKPNSFEPGVTNLEKDTFAPILEEKYGIVLKTGVVNSVFGESIFDENSLRENEIEIDGKTYFLNPDESKEGLVGRRVAFFINEEDKLVIFTEPLKDNVVYELEYNSSINFKTESVEYELDDEELFFDVSAETIVTYNGISVGTYTTALMNKYFGKGATITAIDNDEDGMCEIILIRKWEGFPVAFAAGTEGAVVFDYGMTFNGASAIDVTPDDKKIHITVLRNGVPAEFTEIKAGDIVSISSSANVYGDKYIIVELGYKPITGVLSSADGNAYIIDGEEYYVTDALLNAQKTNSDVKIPEMGETYTFYIDKSGQIANVNVPMDYNFGFLAKLNMGRGLDAKCDVKIFTAQGKMINVPVAEKIKLHTDDNFDGFVFNDGSLFIDKIIAEAVERAGAPELYTGDYRSVVQYKLNGKGELDEMWLPLDNTEATSYGETGYQLTKDVLESGNRTYYGVVWGNGRFRLPATSPIFRVPGDPDAKDTTYSLGKIDQTQYNDTLTNKMEFYSVDKFNIVGAALIRGSFGEGDIESYSAFMIVDKVVAGLDADREPVTKLYGWLNGKYTSYTTTEYSLASDAERGWEVVNFENLKFGDFIQVYQSEGNVRRFRVVYRASNPGADRIQSASPGDKYNDNGLLMTEMPSSRDMFIGTGSYIDRKSNAFRIMQHGQPVVCFMKSNKTADVYIIDTTAEKVIIASPADLVMGDKVMVRGTFAGVDVIYVVR